MDTRSGRLISSGNLVAQVKAQLTENHGGMSVEIGTDKVFQRRADETAGLVELNSEEYKHLRPQSRNQRKNYMRNQPCVCGSGKKFKKCCWEKFA